MDTPDMTAIYENLVEDEPECENPNSVVTELHIIYRSGGFIRFWVKSYSYRVIDSKTIRDFEYELAEPHESCKGAFVKPAFIGAGNIECIWEVNTMTAGEYWTASKKHGMAQTV